MLCIFPDNFYSLSFFVGEVGFNILINTRICKDLNISSYSGKGKNAILQSEVK